MKNKALFEDISEFALSLLYPNRCKFCDAVINPYAHICDECKNTLPFIKGEICNNCGAEKRMCACKGRHGNFYEAVAAPLYYTGLVCRCIHHFKFYDERLHYKCLGDMMCKTLKERYGDISFDYVTYIPMREKNLRKRGYNQGRLLAKRISEKEDIPLADNLLVKLFDTKNQRGISEYERRGNMLGVFDINPDFDVNEKVILIVDDVKTTGATLSECGKMLYLYGASAVYCLTAAVVQSKIKAKEVEEKEKEG